ncbi:hypothetical protein PHMEG_00022924 [Phytophthora megakarya]|uniref:Reverse transcriptase n=1 Tax=Phytophthora megakarya TaxID=4795 RepID=A0A225VIA7_9STRA|nr:hypothetical protein PHMEG_00022924 [Phytophthora megakarya]
MSDEKQRDWDTWVDYAVYSYNSGRHSTVLLSPNELMMERRLRAPNVLLRATSVTEAGGLVQQHQKLLTTLKEAHKFAERARRVRRKRDFEPGDRVWMFRPPRDPKASKFVHQWLGPLRVIEDAGYENFLVEREYDGENDEQFIAHVSFLATHRQPMWEKQTKMTRRQTRLYAQRLVPVKTVVPGRSTKRRAIAMTRERAINVDGKRLVEFRRRHRRSRAGQYVLEYQLRPMRTGHEAEHRDNTDTYGGQWFSVAEYDERFSHGKIVEGLEVDGGV